MAKALGYSAVSIEELADCMFRFRVIFNTVPAPVVPEQWLRSCSGDTLKIELASVRGIAGKEVIPALGLPGKMAPESSGALIAKTAIAILRRKEGLE